MSKPRELGDVVVSENSIGANLPTGSEREAISETESRSTLRVGGASR